MAWKKVSPEKCEHLEKRLAEYKHEKKSMFGCPANFVNNNWFAGAHEDNIIVRLSEPDREKIKAEHPKAYNFEPVKGHPIREFIVLPDTILDDEEEFGLWLNRAYSYTSSLPAKEKKSRKKPNPQNTPTREIERGENPDRLSSGLLCVTMGGT